MGKNKRKREFNIIFLTMMIISLSFVTINSIIFYSQNLRNDKELVNIISEDIKTNFSSSLDSINRASKTTFLSEEFYILQDELYGNNLDTATTNIERYFYSKSDSNNTELIRGFGYIPMNNDEFLKDNIIYTGSHFDLYNYYNQTSINFIDTIVNKSNDELYNNGKIYFVLGIEHKNDIIVFSRVVKDLRVSSFNEKLGIGFVEVNYNALIKSFNIGKVLKGYSSFITYNDELIFGDTSFDLSKLDSSKYYVYSTRVLSNDYVFYGVYEKLNVFNDLRKNIFEELLIVLVVMLGFYFIYYKVHKQNLESFQYLVDSFEESKNKHNLELIEPVKDDDEINQVIFVYNNMINTILDDKKFIESLTFKNKKLEIESLHSQINKHFILNVLSVIQSLIVLNKKEESKECIKNLSDFLRYSLSFNLTKVTLKDEVYLAKKYLNLQKVRYPNINYILDIDEEMDDIIVPKMILQPLIENAFVHGLVEDYGILTLSVRKVNDTLSIKIGNTGVISQDKLNNINKKLKDNNLEDESKEIFYGHGIALINIKKRLTLIFGEKVSLYLSVDNENTYSNIDIVMEDKGNA